MTHLRIEQNTITENVTSDIIHKLYETAKAIIDDEELRGITQSQVSLKGNLQTSKAYGDEIDWLEEKFPELFINVAGSKYIRFKDNEVQRVLLNNGIGDGTGITEADVASVTKLNGMFNNNTVITSLDDLRRLPLTELASSEFQNCSNVTSVQIPRTVTRINEGAFGGCTSLKEITIPNTVTFLGARALGQNMYYERITIEDGFRQTYTQWQSGEIMLDLGSINRNADLLEFNIPDNTGIVELGPMRYLSPSAEFVVPAGIKWCKDISSNRTTINKLTFNSPETFVGFYGETVIKYFKNNPSINLDTYDFTNDLSILRNFYGSQVFVYAKTYVNFPKDELRIIQKDMFAGVAPTNAVNDLLGDHVVIIGATAFYNWGDRSETITIPASCKVIGTGAFGSTRPTLFKILATTPPIVIDTYSQTFSGTDPQIFQKQYGQAQPACRIQVPAASLEAYKTTFPWNFYADKYDAIPE